MSAVYVEYPLGVAANCLCWEFAVDCYEVNIFHVLAKLKFCTVDFTNSRKYRTLDMPENVRGEFDAT